LSNGSCSGFCHLNARSTRLADLRV
jgi:hypothetical protein